MLSLPDNEKLRIVEEKIADPRYPRPPSPLTRWEKLELFDELYAAGLIDLESPSDRTDLSERLRIINDLLQRPDCPIPPHVAQSMPNEIKLTLFDKLVEEGAIKRK